MPLTKDDIDAVSVMLHVNGELTFSVLLTRGGLTQRRGFTDTRDRAAVMVKGRTDRCFEDFMAALPEALLEGGGEFEDGGRDGARHDWRFEFGGGMKSLAWAVAYHEGSASLPDEFADVVVQAERLTHSWYVAGVAEETGQPMPVEGAPAPVPEPTRPPAGAARKAAPGRRGAPSPSRAKAGQPVPVTRERMALVILLDLIAFSIPWSLLQWLFVGGGNTVGPPGAGFVLFAIVEFVLLQIARRSPGYWLLGITAGLGQKPQLDASWPVRESSATLAVGIAACGLGVGGLTSWTAYHTVVPYFGLGFPLWLSIALTLLGSLGLILAGVLVLRLDLRGVWVCGGIALLLLLSGVAGWGEWGAFVDAAIADRSAYVDRPVGQGLIGGLVRPAMPLLIMGVPAALLGGVYASWQRLRKGAIGWAGATPAAS